MCEVNSRKNFLSLSLIGQMALDGARWSKKVIADNRFDRMVEEKSGQRYFTTPYFGNYGHRKTMA